MKRPSRCRMASSWSAGVKSASGSTAVTKTSGVATGDSVTAASGTSTFPDRAGSESNSAMRAASEPLNRTRKGRAKASARREPKVRSSKGFSPQQGPAHAGEQGALLMPLRGEDDNASKLPPPQGPKAQEVPADRRLNRANVRIYIRLPIECPCAQSRASDAGECSLRYQHRCRQSSCGTR